MTQPAPHDTNQAQRPASPPLTVIVPTGNRADVVVDCLRSVRWADELIVVDSYSDDGTLAIAHQYADRVLQNTYVNSAAQKNWAIPQATHEWVMIVDTDERVPAALQTEIRAALVTAGKYAGFRIPRENYFLGQAVKHTGYAPDYQLRLFRRDLGRYLTRQVHAHLQLNGPCGTLTNPIVHYAHRSVDQMVSGLLLQMTRWEAQQRLQEQPAHRQPLAVNLLLRPLAAFGLRYIGQGGWRDGSRGLILSLTWAMYVCITYMRMWETSQPVPSNWWNKHWRSYPNGAPPSAVTLHPGPD